MGHAGGHKARVLASIRIRGWLIQVLFFGLLVWMLHNLFSLPLNTMLTLILAVVGIVLSLPFGIVLALGRHSELPVIRAFSVTYIESVTLPQGTNRCVHGQCTRVSAYTPATMTKLPRSLGLMRRSLNSHMPSSTVNTPDMRLTPVA